MSTTWVVKHRTAAGGTKSTRVVSETAEEARQFAIVGCGIPAEAIRSVEPAAGATFRQSFVKTIPGKR